MSVEWVVISGPWLRMKLPPRLRTVKPENEFAIEGARSAASYQVDESRPFQSDEILEGEIGNCRKMREFFRGTPHAL
jgi:hypothetical protein